MKAIKSKNQERKEIENQIQFYLRRGGEVQQVESGVSGRPIGGSFSQSAVSFNQPRESRTLLVDEVKAIDARRHKPAHSPAQTKKVSKPKKVLITDDFGEPLKWVWQEQ